MSINPNAKAQQIKDEANALLTYANGITSASDLTLGDAVRTLAEGYGQGGGGGHGFPNAVLVKHIKNTYTLAELVPDYSEKTPTTSNQQLSAAQTSNLYLTSDEAFSPENWMGLLFYTCKPNIVYTEDVFPRSMGYKYSSVSVIYSKCRPSGESVYAESTSTNWGRNTFYDANGKLTSTTAQIGIYTIGAVPSLYVTTNGMGGIESTKYLGSVSRINTYGKIGIGFKGENRSPVDSFYKIDWENSTYTQEYTLIKIPNDEAKCMPLAMTIDLYSCNGISVFERIKGEN